MAAGALLRNCRRKGAVFAGAFAVLSWFAYPLFVQSAAPVAPPVRIKPSTVSDNRVVMPKGYQQQSVIRDPFQAPQAVLPSNPAIPDSNKQIAAPPAASPQIQLAGVAMGNGTAAAILESRAGSRSYRIGDYVDQYQVSSITLDSVILVGPNGSYVIKMRR